MTDIADITSPEVIRKIRELNDQLRTTLSPAYGRIMLTSTVAALPLEERAKVLAAIQQYSSFDDGNDPHGEHDMAFVEVDGERYAMKIDYYDRDIRYMSDDPSNPAQTIRIATILHMSEY